MWAIIEILLSLAIILVFITEFFWPLVNGKPLFGSFRKSKGNTQEVKNNISLEEKIAKAKEKAEEIKNTQKEIDENLKSAEQLKGEADDLLK